ncbi:hypothetical protein V6Z11_D03G024300 [Gossypium hirsutum]
MFRFVLCSLGFFSRIASLFDINHLKLFMPLIHKQLIGFISRVEFVIPTLGLHMAVNDCAAAAVATSMGVPVSLRSEFVVAESGIKIVNDAFNANPISTKAGIDTLKNINCDGKRVAILGDMFELGTHEIRVP